MNERKVYASPAILTEDVLEQTSLACNSTVPWSEMMDGEGSGMFAPVVGCAINITKNNAFAEDLECEIMLTDPSQVVALS
jgi:hypothetical protein